MFLELECSVCHQLEFFDTDETADDVNKSICDTCALAVHESIAGQDLQAIPRPTAQQPHSFDLASSASSTPAKDSKCKGKRVDSTHSDANIGEIIVLEDTVGEPHRVNILTDALSHARSLLQSGLADSEEMDVARATLLSLGCETVDSILGLSPNNPDCQGGGVGPSARFTGFKGSLFGPRKDYVSRPSSSSSSMTRSLPNYSTLHQSSLKRRRIADFNDDAALKETSPSPTKVRPVREPLLNQEAVKTEQLRESLSALQSQRNRAISINRHTRLPRSCYLVTYTPPNETLNAPQTCTPDGFTPRPIQMCANLFPSIPYIRIVFKGGKQSFKHLQSYTRFLEEGLAGYEFFTFTKHLLEERSCIMVDSKYIEDLRTKSQLGQLREQSKLIKYSGLLFNELKQPIVTLHEITVSLDPDLRRAGYTFTDGCGRVSADVARTLTAGMFPTPSVLQIRAPGIKGILVMDPQLPKKSIRFRRSMQKLDLLNLSDTPLVKTIGVAVIGVSKPTHCTGLNSQAIALLVERGLEPEVILAKDKQYKNALNHAMIDVSAAFSFLYICGYDNEFEKLVAILNFSHGQKPALQLFWNDLRNMQLHHVRTWRRGKSRAVVTDETDDSPAEGDPLRRLYLPIRDSRNLFGICDEFSVLPAGKCYINVAASDGSFQTVTGKVALWRNPCYHPGDIVLLEAVENEKLSHLKNVIVFSVLGSRPAADMCAGGDLDGDTFHVVWDNAIVSCLKAEVPFNYQPDHIKSCILNTVSKLGVPVYISNNLKRAQGSDDTVSKESLIATLTNPRLRDNIIGLIDSLLLEFQKFEYRHTERSRLNRLELMNLLTALFSASVDALPIDLDTMLNAVRKEIVNSRSDVVSEFKRIHEACLWHADTSAALARVAGQAGGTRFSLFWESLQEFADRWWQDPDRVKAFRPQCDVAYVDLTKRLLNLGKRRQKLDKLPSLMTSELMGALEVRLKEDTLIACVQAISSLEANINKTIDSFKEVDLTNDNETAIEACNKHQTEFEMLFNCHESFADVVSNIASALKSSIDSSSLLEVDKILKNEIFMMTSGLPIYSARSCLTNFIDNNSIVLVLSETGSGKSTCTPNFIANNLYFQGKMVASKQIIVAQPRRSATTELASRLAENRGSFVGGFVGSHIGKSRPRMNKNRTIINCVTYGILLAYARKDPFLRGYSVIVVDEVHENASDLHFLFGILKHALAHNLDLKIVLMSASVDFTKITRFFPGCQVITVEGRSFPVEECFLGGFSYNHKEYVRNAVLQCIKIHDAWTVGENSDILVFVPTKKDTAKGVELISEFAKSSAAYRNLQAFPFHSSMSEQRKKFIIKRQAIDVWNSLNRAGDRPVVDFNNEEEDWDSGNDFIMYENDNGDLVEFIPDLRKARRIIFCTNIAETSLTIPSIGYVIDCGLQYSVDHSPVMRVIDSKLVPATKVSAVQRMGRAGRLGPGKCFRLYSFEEKEALLSQTFSSPKNFDLHMLQIVEMFADIKQFQWFKEPLDSELGWTYTLLTDSGFLEHDAASEHQILTQDGQFALELDRLEIPACIALFLLRIWRCTSDTHTMIREHCITIAAFIAFGSKPFKPQYSHLHFAKAGYKQLMEYPLKDAFPNSFANVNLFDIWSNLPFHAREKFSLQFDLNFHVMQAVIELRDGLSEFMASKELFLKATAGDMNMGTLSIVPDNSQDTCYFILGHLASACFTHLGYMTETNNVMFIFDSLPEVAEIEPSEKARLAGKSPCQLVLFHSLRRETNKLNGTSKLVVGQIDPLPWVWPEKIPDRFIALYANFFPDFPG